MTVELIVVSHSAKIAEGVAELAEQMAPDVTIHAVGGTDDGGIGTSFDALEQAVSAAGTAVVLCDLGSAVMTAEAVLEFLEEDAQSRFRLADAPIVEGAIAAAVAAQTGGSLEEVLASAEAAGGGPGTEEPSDPTPEAITGEQSADSVQASVRITNDSGLHARPASELVRLASSFTSEITVNGTDAKSVLKVMALGVSCGDEVAYTAKGPDAREALSALVNLTSAGFGE